MTRLILGANPFGGHSHQSEARNKEMLAYYTPERIKETWERAEVAGINTMITNVENPHVIQAVREYLSGGGGSLQWIAQINRLNNQVIDEVVGMGCKALYIHGALVDDAYQRKDAESIQRLCKYAQSCGVPVGVAAHAPEAHVWVDSLNITDFHVVSFFNCGSLHSGKGHTFRLADIGPAIECIRRIQKPCIAYKIMGAGRIDARLAFEYAFEGIKATDVVNVGMHRGDKDNMIEENSALVREILGSV